MDSYLFKVEEERIGIRLDKFIYLVIDGFTRSRIQGLISSGCVCVNDGLKEKNYRVKLNDIVALKVPDAIILEDTKPENIPINIVYEDNDLLIVNKEKGMVVHPAMGNFTGTLVNALLYHCRGNLSDINGVIRPGIVHRIDKDTSGLLIVAKNNFSHQILAQQIKVHSFKREYETVVHGIFKNNFGEINFPIGRDSKDRKKFSVTFKNSKVAMTFYKLLTNYKDFSHLRITLKTGRTHQIRVHMSYINHPVAGDYLYGPKKLKVFEKKLNGQCLHAKYIGFVHPRRNNFLEFESKLPKYFLDFLQFLENKIL